MWWIHIHCTKYAFPANNCFLCPTSFSLHSPPRHLKLPVICVCQQPERTSPPEHLGGNGRVSQNLQRCDHTVRFPQRSEQWFRAGACDPGRPLWAGKFFTSVGLDSAFARRWSEQCLRSGFIIRNNGEMSISIQQEVDTYWSLLF